MSTAAKQSMLAKLTAYFDKLTLVVKPVVFESGVVIAAGATKTYNLATLITGSSAYNLLSARVEVLVLDTEAGSATLNNYINSQAVITVGKLTNGTVTIVNNDINSRTVLVRIDYPTSKV